MKLLKFFSIGVFVLCSLIINSTVLVEAASEPQITQAKPVVLATVNIYKAKIVSQDNNKFNISFDLANSGGVQSGVKYSVKLVKETNNKQSIADEKIYDETLTLAENSTVKKEITYTAPANLDGDYTILLSSKNENSFVFGLVFVGKVKLASTVKGIKIAPETCFLSVVGEKGDKKYDLTQGVDISSSETLKLTCSVSNSDIKSITAVPTFETHYRTVYGEVVDQTEVVNNSVTLTKGENKIISLLLPKAINPQAYDVKVGFKTDDIYSNTVIVHYVLQGISATIQNLSLNKDYYNKGDTAILSFSWTQRADSFAGSRLKGVLPLSDINLSGTIQNSKGKNCSPLIDQLVSKDLSIKTEIPIQITSSCINPQILLTLKNKDGLILDQKSFSVETTTKENNQKSNPTTLITIIILLIIIIIILIKLKKKNTIINSSEPVKKDNSITMNVLFIFLLLVSVGILSPVLKVSASEITIDNNTTAHVDMNDSVYAPGNTINVTSSAYYNSSSNVAKNIYINGYIYGDTYTGGTMILLKDNISGGSSIYQNQTFPTPSTPGNYNLKVNVYANTTAYFKAETGPYSIVLEDFVSFVSFKTKMIGYFEEIHGAGSATSGMINSSNIFELNDAFYPYGLTLSGDEGVTIYSNEFSIPFTVVGSLPPTVSVTVNQSKTPAPILKSAGMTNGVDISWIPTNATSCKCIYGIPDVNGVIQPDANGVFKSCGSGGLDNNFLGVGPFNFKVDKTTKFSVTCKNN